MTHSRVLFAAAAIAAAATSAEGQSRPAQTPVIGTWLLESIVDTLPNGSLSYWMGRQPTGAIIYAPSGHVSVQFMRDPRPLLPVSPGASVSGAQLAGADPFGVLGAEPLREALQGYYAYFGRYQVTRAGDSITHFVDTSLRPNEVGATYRRAIRIDGDRLLITLHTEVSGVRRHRVLTWRRAP